MRLDKASFSSLLCHWVSGTDVDGAHELLLSALVMDTEKERTTNLGGQPIEGNER
ncbi:hypothetical protein ACFLWS_03695 [Chloroflexota bacterium]